MAYVFLPSTGQTLGGTRDQIRQNFVEIDSTLTINHYSMNEANTGKHKFASFPVQAADPTTAASESAIYSKTGVPNIFIRNQSDGQVYQLTNMKDASIASFATFTNYLGTLNGGWTFLPGGLLLQYGILPSPTDLATITFPLSFNSAAEVFSITLGGVRSNTNDKVISILDGSITATKFQVTLSGSSPPTNVFWQAIGK